MTTTKSTPARKRASSCQNSEPEIWRGLDLTWHPELPNVIRRVVSWYNAGCGGLVLAGGFGCGKTHIAHEVYEVAAPNGPARRLPDVFDWSAKHVESVSDGQFYKEPKLLEKIRQSYSDDGRGDREIIRDCQTTRCLILDDLGAAYVKDSSRDWYEDLIWRLFDARIDAGLLTLITTNLPPADLKIRIGGRAFSRLQQMLGSPENFVLMFDINDFRARDW